MNQCCWCILTVSPLYLFLKYTFQNQNQKILYESHSEDMYIVTAKVAEQVK